MLVKCKECGGQVSDKAATCPHCGAPVACGVGTICMPSPKYEPHYYANDRATKSKIAFVILALFLGFLGVHKFYIGRVGAGFAQLAFFFVSTFGLLLVFAPLEFIILAWIIVAIWVIVDICKTSVDADGNQLT